MKTQRAMTAVATNATAAIMQKVETHNSERGALTSALVGSLVCGRVGDDGGAVRTKLGCKSAIWLNIINTSLGSTFPGIFGSIYHELASVTL